MPHVLRANKMSTCIGCFTCMNVCAAFNHKSHSLNKSSIHVKTSGGLGGSYVASACHACRDAGCVEICPSGALTQRKGGGVILNESLCMGCKRCLKACTAHAIGFDEQTNTPIICRQCRLCATYCPHKCLTMEEVPE